MHQIYFRPRAMKGLKKAPRKHQLKINEAFNNIAKGQFKGIDISKLTGTEDGYRFRTGRWRVLFSLNESKKEVEIIDIFLKKGDKDYKKRIKQLKR